MKIESRIVKARTKLLLDFPWFGSLSMRLGIESSDKIETVDVDGTRMRYNPAFADSLSDQHLVAVMAHEVMHCALLHPFRRNGRDSKLWNQACDYAINSQLVSAGFHLPDNALLDTQFDGLSADVIYARLANKPKDPDNGNKPDTGTISDPQPTPASGQPKPMTESDWAVATQQASAVSKAAGKLSEGLAESVKAAQKSPADWLSILREFVEDLSPSDYSWIHPNRRFAATGLYLPGILKQNLGHVAIAVDTSGSIDTNLLALFANELNSIFSEAKPSKITVLYCDSQVQKIQEFEPCAEFELSAIGRGGTAFQPVFDAISKFDSPPACLLYFTDLDSSDSPSQPSDYSTLWVTPLSVTRHPPFGSAVRISQH